ncbi:MAG: lysophospholipid acyltransferase family protein [Proteobacteria bacterium]|nr:lysophospholipid acyltransferase family protein [Pseudomonadota bacterium]
MTDQQNRPDFTDVESRRSFRSRRGMSIARRVYYFFGLPLLRAIFFLLSRSYRVQVVIGSEIADHIVADTKNVYAPCYWHQNHVLCSNMIKNWISRGFKACFLISPSVDGEVPERVARSWGAEVIRGSANQTGALALRDMQQVMKRGVSVVTTADGPSGPKYEFKAGAILMARIGGAPMIPLACAADRAWYLKRWDDFMIPKPFARVVLAVGAPIEIPRHTPIDRMEDYRLQMQYAINALMAESRQALKYGEPR